MAWWKHRDFLPSERGEAVVREAHVAVPGETGRDSSDLTLEARPVDLDERVLQVRGQKAVVLCCCGIGATF